MQYRNLALSSILKIVSLLENNDNEIYLLANQGNQGQLLTYNVDGNAYKSIDLPQPGEVSDLIKLGKNHLLIAHENGIFTYYKSTYTIVPFVNGISPSSLKYDELNKVIYCCDGNYLRHYK